MQYQNQIMEPMNPSAFSVDCGCECDCTCCAWWWVPFIKVDELYEKKIVPAHQKEKDGSTSSKEYTNMRLTVKILSYFTSATGILVMQILMGIILQLIPRQELTQWEIRDLAYKLVKGRHDWLSKVIPAPLLYINMAYMIASFVAQILYRVFLFRDIFGKAASCGLCCNGCAGCCCLTCFPMCWDAKLVKHAEKFGGAYGVGLPIRAAAAPVNMMPHYGASNMNMMQPPQVAAAPLMQPPMMWPQPVGPVGPNMVQPPQQQFYAPQPMPATPVP